MQPKDSVPVPRFVTDVTLEVGTISRIIGGLSSFHFAGPRPISRIIDGTSCSFFDQITVFDL